MTSSPPDELRRLARGFRQGYLTYDELSAQLRAWAEAFPAIARLRSMGQSAEGRELWVLTIGAQPERKRPSLWIDGNMHAQELCGSSVALGIAEDALRLQLGDEEGLEHVPRAVRERAREVLVHVAPRLSPDGAEHVLDTGSYVRSNPRDRRQHGAAPRWVPRDLDGDGLALLMRRRDPAGEFVESEELPGVLVPRGLTDEGPFYKVYPEGVIEPFDGHTIPAAGLFSDNDTDLNRNFPYAWAPEPQQAGAGAYPTSEPEARAVVEFASAHPEIFAWLNLHTYGGVFIRPLGDGPDHAMAPFDRDVYRELGEVAESVVGYPTVSGHDEFLYEPGKPLRGDLGDYAYHHRGCVTLVCELWSIFRQIGIERVTPFIEHYRRFDRAHFVALHGWDREHNQQRAFKPWVTVQHPQLGEVEVGGVDPRVGLVNPPPERLQELCGKLAHFALVLASLAPAPAISRRALTPLGGGLSRLDVTVENRGYLPTYVLDSARQLAFNGPLWVEAQAGGDCELVEPGRARVELGHLGGWGQRDPFRASPFFLRSSPVATSSTVSFLLRGEGPLTLRVGGPRVGFVEETLGIRITG
jgi:Zinc carboxypeptidase